MPRKKRKDFPGTLVQRGETHFWRWQGQLLPGAELVLLAPFLAGLTLSWSFFYDADRASYQAAQRLLDLDPFARAWVEAERPALPPLGRIAFVVFQADRSVGRAEKLERWSTICREAAMLAGRLRVPEVLAASSVEVAIGAEDYPVMLSRDSPQKLADLTSPRDLALFVGPEGGWTGRELDLGMTTASLGPRNLRAETAALVGLAVALAARGG